MIKLFASGIALFLLAFASYAQEHTWNGPSADFSHGKLKVSENKRFLVYEDGTPFFYLGDTGWELFHRLNKADTKNILKTAGPKDLLLYRQLHLPNLMD